ncbi:MAG: hypothetical protein M0R77_00510 [Gammaproteobacteria bacterium]|nr:hypothetical protein [Acholeplasmataceae bacterium]MCK9529036.1 hypothetical protein [Gammaproteobacteria bacterium]
MAGNRKAFETQVLADCERVDPGGNTAEYYRVAFSQMSDSDIDAFVNRLITGEESLVVFRENGKEPTITRDEKIDIAEEWGIALRERIWIDDGQNPKYLSNKKYLILQLPIRRQAQILDDKKTLPKHSNTIDEITGQATGESKGSTLSNVEAQVILGYDLEKSLLEFMKVRGGDILAFRAMNKSIDATGGASIEALMKIGSEAESVATLRSYLYGMHLNNTL